MRFRSIITYEFAMWFQPLTNFFGKKCKRCGVYEEDKILYDDVFDEWELCPSDFTTPDGRYIHFKEKEFNASFLCPDCLPISGGEFLATFFLGKLLTDIMALDFTDNCVIVVVTYMIPMQQL